MKIGIKIALQSAIAFIAICICVWKGYYSANTLSEMFLDCGNVPLTNVLIGKEVSENIIKMRELNGLIYFYKNDHKKVEELVKRIEEIGSENIQKLEFLNKNVSTSLRPILKEAIEELKISTPLRVKINEFALAGKWNEFLEQRMGGEYDIASEMSNKAILEYCEAAKERALNYCFVTSQEEADSLKTTLFLVGIIATIIYVIVAVLVIIGIIKPLKKAMEAANHVAEGNLNVDLTSHSKDEIGILMNALSTMVESINQLIKDSEKLSTAAIEGRLEIRADINKHKGAYKELIHGTNKILDTIIAPLTMTAEYVDRISKGDMPPKITDSYKGDFNEIKNNLNGCMDTISLLVKEINQSITEATNGNLQYRADVNKFQGDYKNIMIGVNNLAETYIEPIKTTAEFIQNVVNGSENIEKITKEYKGEFNDMKNALNLLYDTIFIILGEFIDTAKEARKGNLSRKADASKVKGGWIILIDCLNSLTTAAESIINDAGAALSVMATGNLTPRIKKDYPGKFGEMRDNINHLGIALGELIDQLHREMIHHQEEHKREKRLLEKQIKSNTNTK